MCGWTGENTIERERERERESVHDGGEEGEEGRLEGRWGMQTKQATHTLHSSVRMLRQDEITEEGWILKREGLSQEEQKRE